MPFMFIVKRPLDLRAFVGVVAASLEQHGSATCACPPRTLQLFVLFVFMLFVMLSKWSSHGLPGMHCASLVKVCTRP